MSQDIPSSFLHYLPRKKNNAEFYCMLGIISYLCHSDCKKNIKKKIIL